MLSIVSLGAEALPSFEPSQLNYKYRWRWVGTGSSGAGATDDQAFASSEKAKLQGDPDVTQYEFYEDGYLVSGGGTISKAKKKPAVVAAVAVGGLLLLGGAALLARKHR